MFSILSGLPPEVSEKIAQNWIKMQKEHQEKIKKQKEEELKKQKQEEEEEKMYEFIRKNPPKTFKDMMIMGPYIAKMQQQKRSIGVNTEPMDSETKPWFTW